MRANDAKDVTGGPIWTAERVREIVDGLAGLDGPLLPILHAIQAEFGCVPSGSVPVIAEVLNLTRAEVHGVVSFYHDFRDAPAGRRIIRLCRAEACQSMGGEAMAAGLLARLGVDWGGTTADGAVTVEPVYCLGLCAVAPSTSAAGATAQRPRWWTASRWAD